MLEINGLTPAEFLRPFGDVGNLNNYIVRTTEKTEYRLDKFRVNFVDSHRMTIDSKETARIQEFIFSLQRPEIPKTINVPTKKEDVRYLFV
jgi:hypothetical protein